MHVGSTRHNRVVNALSGFLTVRLLLDSTIVCDGEALELLPTSQVDTVQ